MTWTLLLLLGLISPGLVDDPLSEAKALRDKGEWAEAGTRFRESMDKEPTGPLAAEARFWTGFCLVKQGENQPASEVLAPFEAALADDTWADDALLQLGEARLGSGDKPGALAAWERQISKYPDSVWRAEVMLKTVNLLFFQTEDFPACLAACRRVVDEFPDRESTSEARYSGAYCLNVLRRFSESEDWAEKNFDPESPLEEAWRRALGVQRDLLRGKVETALSAVDSLDGDFPDLDQESRHDLKLRTTHLLRYNGRADRARQLLLAELGRSGGRVEEEVATLLDELAEIIGDDHRPLFLESLARLSDDPGTPLVVRVAARERRARVLISANELDPATQLLRQAIETESIEYARVRAALTLADVLSENRDDRPGAVKLLSDLLPSVGRRDLAHQIRAAIEKARPEDPQP